MLQIGLSIAGFIRRGQVSGRILRETLPVTPCSFQTEGAEFNGQHVDEGQALRILGEGTGLLFAAGFCAADPGLVRPLLNLARLTLGRRTPNAA